MAHLDTPEAAEATAPISVEDKAANFEEYLFDDDEQEETADDGEVEADEAEDEPEVDDEQDDEEEDEPEAPAIDVPISLNAEEKEVFAQLPMEAQQAWAASETRRNTDVQTATTKAADAQRAADAAAANAETEAKRNYADQLERFASNFAPQEPNRAHYPDDASYLVAAREYDGQSAQFQQLVQQVQSIKTEADAAEQANFTAQRDRELMQIPEVANPETRQAYLDSAFSPELISELGYDQAELAQIADGSDVKRLHQIAQWRDKAAQFDKATSNKMKKVRSFKGKSLKPGAAPHGKTRAAKSDQAWSNVKASKGNKAKQADAMAEYLESAGHL